MVTKIDELRGIHESEYNIREKHENRKMTNHYPNEQDKSSYPDNKQQDLEEHIRRKAEMDYIEKKLKAERLKKMENVDWFGDRARPNVQQQIEDYVEATNKPIPASPDYKFNEAQYLKEMMDYINKTYGQHYSREKFQAMEFIIDGGHGVGFCVGDILKYAQRYGKKGTREDARKDILKIIHYAILLLHVHDNDPNA